MVSFRKRVKIAPGINLNFSKSGVSTSFGPRGAKVTVGKNGVYMNTSIPGTGIYSRKKILGRKSPNTRRGHQSEYKPIKTAPIRTKAANQAWGTVYAIIGIACLIAAFFGPASMMFRIIVGGLTAFMLLGSIMFYTAESIEDVEERRAQKAILDSKAKCTVPALKPIPAYSDEQTAEIAYSTALTNFGLATTVAEVLDTNTEATKCLTYAHSPKVEIWGTSDFMELHHKIGICHDNALIRIATNARFHGESFDHIKSFLRTENGKTIWDNTLQ